MKASRAAASGDRARLDYIHKHECSQFEVRARTIRGGAIQHVRQCLECGEPAGGPLRQAGQVPPFDDSLLSSWSTERRELAERLHHSKTSDWWVRYEEYLSTPEWKDMRIRVLARDRQLCQGCLSATATEVHHLSYEHVTAEFAFELTSLCEPCHERMHQEEEK
jgi:5-methylcytosine-specific restriction endonuclease McrA